MLNLKKSFINILIISLLSGCSANNPQPTFIEPQPINIIDKNYKLNNMVDNTQDIIKTTTKWLNTSINELQNGYRRSDDAGVKFILERNIKSLNQLKELLGKTVLSIDIGKKNLSKQVH